MGFFRQSRFDKKKKNLVKLACQKYFPQEKQLNTTLRSISPGK